MSRSEPRGATLPALVADLAAAAGASDAVAEVDERTVQDLLAVATALYAGKRLSGASTPAFDARGDVAMPTATDVAVTVSAMLESAHIEVFELGLWQTWGTGSATAEEHHA